MKHTPCTWTKIYPKLESNQHRINQTAFEFLSNDQDQALWTAKMNSQNA